MINKIEIFLLKLLIVLLPFHAISMNLIKFQMNFNFTYLNIWKEIIILILGILFILKLFINKFKIKLDLVDYFIFGYIFWGILSGIFITKDIMMFSYGFKYDFDFLILFFLVKNISFTKKEINNIINLSLSMFIGIIIFGILQLLILPWDFLKFFGYNEIVSSWKPFGPLPIYHTLSEIIHFPRLQSTLSGPNQLASYILVFIYMIYKKLVINYKNKIKWGKIFYFIILILAFIALILTFSRSAYIALFICGLILFFKNWKIIKKYMLYITIPIFIFLILIFINLNTITNILIKPSSTQGHFERSMDGIIYSLKQPLGHGIGRAGPASTYTDDVQKIGWIPESWYLQISLELGILGLLLFLIIMYLILYHSFQKNIYISLSLLSILIMCVFLHSLEESATSLTLFTFLGFLYKK